LQKKAEAQGDKEGRLETIIYDFLPRASVTGSHLPQR
jgi:hypothetical protein